MSHCRRGAIRIVILIMIVFGSALSMMAQGSEGLSFSVYPSPAPNRHGSGVSLTAWETWVERALDSVENIRGNIGNAGNDPAAFIIIRNVKPREYLVTANPSWRGKADPTGAFANQQGNRLHYVLHVRGDGTVRFKFEDISWDWWSSMGWFDRKRSMAASPPDGYSAAFNRVDCTYGYGYDWGADRVKGGTDDVKVCNSDTTLVDELFYVGAGYGHAADTCKDDTTRTWCEGYRGLPVQEYLFDTCDYFNKEQDEQYGYWVGEQVGMLFRVVGSDGNTYTHTEKLNNPEYGRALNPANCRPFPPAKKKSSSARKISPPVYTGEELLKQGYYVSAAHGLRSGIQFQRRDASAVGIRAVLDAGFIDAVDVWGYAEQRAEVCFPPGLGPGPLLFKDAATTPHTIRVLPAAMKSGMVCATITGQGMVIMVESWQGASLPTPIKTAPIPLQNCLVTTTEFLNFRDAPGGGILLTFRPNATLAATERSADWFRVDFNETSGWISGDYVVPEGDCE